MIDWLYVIVVGYGACASIYVCMYVWLSACMCVYMPVRMCVPVHV